MKEKKIMFHEILRNECRVFGKPYAMDETVERLYYLEKKGRESEKEACKLLKESVEKLSHGENTVLYDDAGIPSIMVRIPAMRCKELLDGNQEDCFHPAFILGDHIIREIWVSKYLNSIVNGRLTSLPMSIPQRIETFDEAVERCRAKGANWLPMPFQLRMAIALWCRKKGFLPKGNNNYGHDFMHPEEAGILSGDGLSLTGSGPVEWSHNGRCDGIWDLNGNLNEWDAGFRLMNGEIQFIDMEGLMMPDGDWSSDSPLWRGLNMKGELLLQGKDTALHYTVPEGGIQLTIGGGGKRGIGNCAFEKISAGEGIEISDVIRLLGLFPSTPEYMGNLGWRWVNTEGEVMPLCGGAYGALDHAGIFFAGVTKLRKDNYKLAGVRCIYIDPKAIEEG